MTELIDEMPKTWSDIKLRQWRDICLINEEDAIERTIAILTILLECSEETIRDLPFNEYKELVASTNFIGKKVGGGTITKFELGGKKFGIIPRLDSQFISTGEFLDIEEWKKEPVKNIHNIAALIYRPITWEDGDDYGIAKYSREGFNSRAQLFLEEMPITHCHSAVLFFSASVMKSTEIITDYLQEILRSSNQEVKKEKKKTHTPSKKSKEKGSKKSGDGIH